MTDPFCSGRVRQRLSTVPAARLCPCLVAARVHLCRSLDAKPFSTAVHPRGELRPASCGARLAGLAGHVHGLPRNVSLQSSCTRSTPSKGPPERCRDIPPLIRESGSPVARRGSGGQGAGRASSPPAITAILPLRSTRSGPRPGSGERRRLRVLTKTDGKVAQRSGSVTARPADLKPRTMPSVGRVDMASHIGETTAMPRLPTAVGACADVAAVGQVLPPSWRHRERMRTSVVSRSHPDTIMASDVHLPDRPRKRARFRVRARRPTSPRHRQHRTHAGPASDAGDHPRPPPRYRFRGLARGRLQGRRGDVGGSRSRQSTTTSSPSDRIVPAMRRSTSSGTSSSASVARC